MKKLASVLFLITLFESCSNKQVVEQYWDATNKQLKERYETVKGKPGIKDGKYESFYKDGSPELISYYKQNQLCDSLLAYDNTSHHLKEKAFYKDGKLNGHRFLFFEDGKVMIMETYTNDKEDGVYLSYFKNGKKEQEGQYVDGKLSGVWHYYYENGQVKEIVTYADGHEFGPYFSFYPNGNRKATGYYLDEDTEDSVWHQYYETGELKEIANYKEGMEEGLTKTFNKDATVSKEIMYKAGIPVVYKDYVNKKFTTHAAIKGK